MNKDWYQHSHASWKLKYFSRALENSWNLVNTLGNIAIWYFVKWQLIAPQVFVFLCLINALGVNMQHLKNRIRHNFLKCKHKLSFFFRIKTFNFNTNSYCHKIVKLAKSHSDRICDSVTYKGKMLCILEKLNLYP